MLLSQVFELRRNLPLYIRHGFIIEGKEGGGSFVMRKEIEAIIANTEDRVIIVDCFDSLEPNLTECIEKNDGRRYDIKPDSDIRLNLLTESSVYENKDFLLSNMSDLLLAIWESLNGSASPRQRALIDGIIVELYRKSDAPATAELIDALKIRYNEGCSFAFLSFLEDFKLFHGATNINLDNRLTLFHVKPSRYSRASVFPILEYIKNVLMTEHAPVKRTWIYIRHLDAILSDNKPGKACCVERLWREARRYGAVCTATILKRSYNEALDLLLRNSDSFYFLTPSLEDDFWFKWLDIEPDGIVQMLYTFGGSTVHKGSITSIAQENIFKKETNMENSENLKLPTVTDMVDNLKEKGEDSLANSLDKAQEALKYPSSTVSGQNIFSEKNGFFIGNPGSGKAAAYIKPLHEDLAAKLAEAGYKVIKADAAAPSDRINIFSGTFDVFGDKRKDFIVKLADIFKISVLEEDDIRIRFVFTEKANVVHSEFELQKIYADYVALLESMKGYVEMVAVYESEDSAERQVMDREKVKEMICQAIDNIPDCAEIRDCYVEHGFCASKAYIKVIIEGK